MSEIIKTSEMFDLYDDGTFYVRGRNVQVLDDMFFNFEEKELVKNVVIDDEVVYIGICAFRGFANMENLTLGKKVIEIDSMAFEDCEKLQNVKFNDKISCIAGNAFNNCDLQSLDLPESLQVIGCGAFSNNKSLKSFVCPRYLSELSYDTFYGCSNLSIVFFNEELQTIQEGCFAGCDLRCVYLPDSLEYINGYINCDAFKCKNLQYISYPATTRIASNKFFKNIGNAKLVMRYNGKDIVIVKGGKKDFSNTDVEDVAFDREANVVVFKDGSVFINTYKGICLYNPNEITGKFTKSNALATLDKKDYLRLLPWIGYKYLPNKIVVLNMPESEVDLFYSNNNDKNWAKIMQNSNAKTDGDKETLFKLAYNLGVFSKNAKDSVAATSFLVNEYLPKVPMEQISDCFSALHISNFNKEPAQFFMLHFVENPNFLYVQRELEGTVENYNMKLFTQWEYDIKTAYPNAKIVSRQDRDRLTVQDVLSVLSPKKEYENVDERAEKFASAVGSYGYSQENYDVLQKWFLRGLKITNDNMTLKMANVFDDDFPAFTCEYMPKYDNKFEIKADLLGKDEDGLIMGALVGEMTNCCQVVGLAGEDCVEYGMTQPNSSFLVFRDKSDRVLGQAWVWYDEKNNQVTLDNIEVPNTVLNCMEKEPSIELAFIDSLIKVREGIQMAMGENIDVTIGVGYNDISKTLNLYFPRVEDVKTLSGYGDRYTDAETGQFRIPSREQFVAKYQEVKKTISKSATVGERLAFEASNQFEW